LALTGARHALIIRWRIARGRLDAARLATVLALTITAVNGRERLRSALAWVDAAWMTGILWLSDAGLAVGRRWRQTRHAMRIQRPLVLEWPAMERMLSEPAVRRSSQTEPLPRPMRWQATTQPLYADMASQGQALVARVSARQRFVSALSVAALIGVLCGVVVPALQVVGEARNLIALKTLSVSGLKHLEAVQTDLEASGMLSTIAALVDQPRQPEVKAPYTLLVQRQGSMDYGINVTVRPTSAVVTQGSAWQVSTTGESNLPLRFGLPTDPAAQPVASATSHQDALIPDAKTLARVRADLNAAYADFVELHRVLGGGDSLIAGAALLPGLSSAISSARALSDIGYQVTTLGVHGLAAVTPILARLHAGSLGPETTLISQGDFGALQALLTEAEAVLSRVSNDLRSVRVDSLPLSAGQKALLAQVGAMLPHVAPVLAQAPQWLDALGWLLGIGTPRRFLVQTLDRSELRATGGFTGDWAVLNVRNGQVGKITFNDVSRLDYGGNNWVIGQRPPQQYSWWPFYNWGVRDANLSPDFPTSAKLIMDTFVKEGEPPVDGVIQVSPLVVEHILKVIGPLTIPLYHETVTADNLEAKLHYYQLDKVGRQISARLQPDNTSTTPRKRFTSMVGSLLQDKVRALPQAQLLAVVKSLIEDWKNKDLQVYVTQPLIEKTLADHKLDSTVDVTPGEDGFLFVQTNVVAAKTATMVDVQQNDQVTLDTSGGALHHLTITMSYHPFGNLYGYATYRAYARIYVPPQAQLRSGDGFDSGVPFCWSAPGASTTATPVTPPAQWATLPPCPAVPYTADELSCPAGGYSPGARPPSIFGSDGYTPWPDTLLGAPPDRTSDLPGRAMWGGFVTIPPACMATLTVDYYVPGVVHLPAAS
ncbi:MAG TPA: DUF4012 domain-containing protein, partial [Ktedonobacterales bacterium]